eukprot:Lithocolla_globosa_v1_NODE_5628_length_1208_cov_3.777971.p1 type:complete len:332 gc:universal NODE_5628_length_1208_cov_3.777971:1162-167(-)
MALWTLLQMLTVSLLCQYETCRRSKDLENVSVDGQELVVVVDMQIASIAGVVASAALLFMFYLFDWMSYLLLFSNLCVSTIAVGYSFLPCTRKFIGLFYDLKTNKIIFDGSDALFMVFTGLPFVFSWVWTGNWFLNDVLGCSLCIFSGSLLRVNNLKIALALLTGLFFYDIFWVFLSEYFFGSNVMVAVATKSSSNPVVKIAHALNVTAPYAVPEIQLPSKLMFPSTTEDGLFHFWFLGLGDLVVPGLVLGCLFRLSHPKLFRYFWVGFVGYAVGLVAAMMASIVWKVAQPALLFIVPCLFVPVLVLAAGAGDLRALWLGIHPKHSFNLPL